MRKDAGADVVRSVTFDNRFESGVEVAQDRGRCESTLEFLKRSLVGGVQTKGLSFRNKS